VDIEVLWVVLSAQLVLSKCYLNILVVSLHRQVTNELKLEVLIPCLVNAGNLHDSLLRIMEFAVLNEELPLPEMGPKVLGVFLDEDDALRTIPVLVI